IVDSSEKQYSRQLDDDPKVASFFRRISGDERFEFAYHGTDHGVAGLKTAEFIQEWRTYDSVETAMASIERGKKIFENVFGFPPRGGKYCGYESNQFSDESIRRSGFEWWCRFWNRGVSKRSDGFMTGTDRNPTSNFDITTFCDNQVVDIPSTFSGGIPRRLNRILKYRCFFLLRHLYSAYIFRQLRYLIQKKLIVSIQQHIAPARNDGRIQRPNIIHDALFLRSIYQFLKRRNVWFCTCSELADYYRLRQCVRLEPVEPESFRLRIDNPWKKRVYGTMTIKSLNGASAIRPQESDEGLILSNGGFIFNIPAREGVYTILR
ncbi:MAG: hypothetical protein JW795_19335, partial [Chitinivibrionales bacterium]|nr:hypothetical protein [Chitinivibrionales bacterium]